MLQLMGECSGTEINVKQHVVTEVLRKYDLGRYKKKLFLFTLGRSREKEFRTASDTEDYIKGRLNFRVITFIFMYFERINP
jgi:hypothetical protein